MLYDSFRRQVDYFEQIEEAAVVLREGLTVLNDVLVSCALLLDQQSHMFAAQLVVDLLLQLSLHARLLRGYRAHASRSFAQSDDLQWLDWTDHVVTLAFAGMTFFNNIIASRDHLYYLMIISLENFDEHGRTRPVLNSPRSI